LLVEVGAQLKHETAGVDMLSAGIYSAGKQLNQGLRH